MSERIGRCHDCTAPQTEVNMLSRHILELQADKGRLTDRCRDLEAQTEKARSIVHRLLVVIQRHKWWNYEVIDEARAFMGEVDRDKDHD